MSRLSAPTSPAHARFGSLLRQHMERTGVTRLQLAAEIGVTATMVGYWRAGKYLPSLSMMDRLMERFPDSHLRQVVVAARVARCVCGVPFDRKQGSRKTYCSYACQRAAHRLGGRKPDPRQAAIDAFCASCEPEGLCRDDACPLRPFSPLLFVAMHRRAS